MTVRIRESLCVGCALCVVACPEDALWAEGIVEVDDDLCTDCGLCEPECPTEALEVK